MDASAVPFSGDVMQAARAYLDAGCSIIPIEPGGKRPLSAALPKGEDGKPTWQPFQTRQPTVDEVEAWCEAFPSMNLAIVTGAISGVSVVDLDGDAGKASIDELGDAWPSTLSAKSPHGAHHFFAHEPGIRNAARRLPGVDVRGEGGYLLVYPSRLPDGAYAWLRRLPLAPFPAALLDPDEPQCDGATLTTNAPDWVTRAMRQGAERGQRNDVATRLSGYFVSRGMPADIIIEALKPFALACKPPFARAELQQVVSSVMRYRARAMAAGVMDPPVRIRSRTSETYSWAAYGVAIEFRGLRSDGDTMTAETTVTADLPGVPRHLHGPVKFNLLSSPTRVGLVKHLNERLQLNWADLVETACRLAVDSHREGEPAILLSEAPPAPQSVYALEPLLLSDAPTIWFGDGGVGKSMLALAAACTLAGHEVAMPFRATRQFTVLYLDWEWDAWVHRDRMRQLLGAQADNCRVYYRRMAAPMHDQTTHLVEIVERYGIDYLVLDSVGMACGDDPELARSALRFSEAVRTLGIGSLWLAHVTKNGDTDKPFGSVFWNNTARLTWFVQKAQEVGSTVSSLGFYNRKGNSTAKLPTIGISVGWDTDRVSITRSDVSSEPDLARRMTQREQVMALLRRGPMSLSDLADELDMPKRSIAPRLTEWRAQGVITGDDGRWQLAVPLTVEAAPPPSAAAWSHAAASAPVEDW